MMYSNLGLSFCETLPLKQVDVGMALIHIGLDEQSSILEVDAWMRLAWTDEYLAWNKSDFEGKNMAPSNQSIHVKGSVSRVFKVAY